MLDLLLNVTNVQVKSNWKFWHWAKSDFWHFNETLSARTKSRVLTERNKERGVSEIRRGGWRGGSWAGARNSARGQWDGDCWAKQARRVCFWVSGSRARVQKVSDGGGEGGGHVRGGGRLQLPWRSATSTKWLPAPAVDSRASSASGVEASTNSSTANFSSFCSRSAASALSTGTFSPTNRNSEFCWHVLVFQGKRTHIYNHIYL